MAAEIHTQGTGKESLTQNELFVPKDTIDQPCDVVLVVEDGKQFKAHRQVLSKASPFFEKLLNSDMKESEEGVVRLEMFSESVMAATLEFIYTGHVQILAEDNARDLFVMADYLLLQKLKSLAEGVLAQTLDISNCISTYYFSERYQCEGLLSKSKKFIFANFTVVYAANREDVLNMSSKEIEMWISSDEINVDAEEDVLKILLAWINHDKSKRKKYFAELFYNVRLVYIPRDFLISDVVTNNLVIENEGCLDLVKDALNMIDSKNCDDLVSIPPRKSLETPAIVMPRGAEYLCYLPGEDTWFRLGEIPSEYNNLFRCFWKGKLYLTTFITYPMEMVSFNPYTNSWMQLSPLENRWFGKMFVGTGDEMYALLCDACFPGNVEDSKHNRSFGLCVGNHSMFISKYKPESHSWEDITSFDHFRPKARVGYCIVASDHFIYFIGGYRGLLSWEMVEWQRLGYDLTMSDVERYDLSKNQWDKVADIQEARTDAYGAAASGKVFIAGGNDRRGNLLYSCEMYDETTSEWQFTVSLKKPEAFSLRSLLAADGKLYAVRSHIQSLSGCFWEQIRVECYNPEKNEWNVKTETALPTKKGRRNDFTLWAGSAGVMKVFKGLPNIRPLETSTSDSPAFWSYYGADLVLPGASSSHKTDSFVNLPVPGLDDGSEDVPFTASFSCEEERSPHPPPERYDLAPLPPVDSSVPRPPPPEPTQSPPAFSTCCGLL